MSDGVRYHLRRGRMPKVVDELGRQARAQGTVEPISRIAAGSVAELKPLGLDDHEELGELAEPGVGHLPMSFGAVELVVEHHGDRVALVLPGMVRLVGSADEARALAALLLTRKQRRERR